MDISLPCGLVLGPPQASELLGKKSKVGLRVGVAQLLSCLLGAFALQEILRLHHSRGSRVWEAKRKMWAFEFQIQMLIWKLFGLVVITQPL